MKDIQQTLSAWARLSKAVGQPQARSDRMNADPSARNQGLSAIEIELRAMRAKEDKAFSEAMAALKNVERPHGR